MSMTDVLSKPTYRSTRGRVPVFRPLLNGEEFVITIQEATFQLGENNHDLAALSCTSADLTTTDGLVDSTLSFYYGQAPRTELFTGYITAVDETQAGKGNLSFKLAVMGATQVMQKGQPKFWRNKTISSAVESLSYINGLGFYSHPHTFLWDSLAQTTETDWQMATALAKRVGWSLFNRFGVLLLLDPMLLIRTQGSYATLLSADDRDFEPTENRRLIEFSPSEKGSTVPENMGAKIAYFTDSNDVQVTTETGEFKSFTFVSGHVINSVEEANLYANADTVRTSEWNQKAEARIWGDSDIYPGMCVDVITSNPAAYRNKFDGRWLVRSVRHHMDISQYQTSLLLGRPASDTPVSHDAYRSFWQDAAKSRPTMSIQNKAWLSSWTDPRVRSVL